MQITRSKTWDVPDEILDGIAADLITAAVEGGINYWASVSDYRWGDPTLGHSNRQPWQDGDRRYACATIHDAEAEADEDGEPDFPPTLVDVERMKVAIAKVAAGQVAPFFGGYTKTFADRLTSLFDELAQGVPLDQTDYDYDAGDADCMMQIAVLGEVTYG